MRVALGNRSIGHRWIVCALLFLAMVINYIDRQTIGLLKPTLAKEYGWSETDYGNLIVAFQGAYAVSYLLFGRLIDRIGARFGFGVAFALWQVAHIFHAAARSLTGFMTARLALGIGEGGAFPAGMKAIAEWFPQRERAMATGLLAAGNNIGAIVTPLVVPVLTLRYGWRSTFIVTGVVGLLWLPAWLAIYRHPSRHGSVSPEELAYIQQDSSSAPVAPVGMVVARPSLWSLFKRRETIAYACGKFLTDPIWWMFLFWLPDFLGKRHGLDLKSYGPPLVVIYLMSDAGSVLGGWSSSRAIQRGATVNRARKTTMLICALGALPIGFAAITDSLWLSVAIISLAIAAHQGFAANLYTFPSDIFPASVVGTVAGIGGMIGAIGGMAMARYAGVVLERLGTYTPIFALASTAYLMALLLIHLLSPRMEPVR